MVATKQKGDEHVKTEEQSTEWYAFLGDAEDGGGGTAIKTLGPSDPWNWEYIANIIFGEY